MSWQGMALRGNSQKRHQSRFPDVITLAKDGNRCDEIYSTLWEGLFCSNDDFCTKEIIVWSISRYADWKQQKCLFEDLLSKLSSGAHPILHSDMGWQYQQYVWVNFLQKNGIVQSMSRKGNCLDMQRQSKCLVI